MLTPPVHAVSYLDFTGFTDLKALLGPATPNGAGVKVAQVEAPVSSGAYAPYDPASVPAAFTGKTLTLKDGSAGVSSHAANVASIFYGNGSAVASGITLIDAFNANNWLDASFLRTSFGLKPLTTDARIANHSWVGGSGASADTLAAVLSRVDWIVQVDDYIQVAGMNNGGAQADLLADSYNAILVGCTNASHAAGTTAVNSFYTAGRTRPDLVGPSSATSFATPMVSSTAAMLVGMAHDNPSLSQSRFHRNRLNAVIYDGETSEVVKAVLMAGADRRTFNKVYDGNTADITAYRDTTAHQTTNGLDSRYGAGQVDAFHSYMIEAAGEKDSTQDGGTGVMGAYGWDYDNAFGGASGANSVATYTFTTKPGQNLLTTTLVWNAMIAGGSGIAFNTTGTLYHMDLAVYDLTNLNTPIVFSASDLDNTQNIQTRLANNHTYQLRVTADTSGGNFNWDYGLAWRLVPDYGDFDHDGDIDAADVDLMGKKLGTTSKAFDLNNDGLVNSSDFDFMISNVVGTLRGDANFDGVVDVSDLVVLAGNFGLNGGWANGDFNGDGKVDIGDLVVLAQNFDLSEVPPDQLLINFPSLSVSSDFTASLDQVLLQSAPEPSAATVLLIALAGLPIRRIRRCYRRG
ncbi:MAG: hypothetical protein GC162_01500 [Planctomycetes bacterium]|nr:hypothetical protein [Planctomycetota bacterium]